MIFLPNVPSILHISGLILPSTGVLRGWGNRNSHPCGVLPLCASCSTSESRGAEVAARACWRAGSSQLVSLMHRLRTCVLLCSRAGCWVLSDHLSAGGRCVAGNRNEERFGCRSRGGACAAERGHRPVGRAEVWCHLFCCLVFQRHQCNIRKELACLKHSIMLKNHQKQG